MKINYTFTFGFLFPLLSMGQTLGKPEPIQRSYLATVSEGILSVGNLGKVTLYDPTVGAGDSFFGNEPSPIIRYSTFLHFGEQLHVNLGKSFGFYTGIGVRNIGMINRLNDSIKVKQRVYALGVPVGIKLGDMQKRVYAALGAELELFFNYKQKTFLGSGRGEKVEKFNEWFSDRTPLLNPSLFVEFNFKKGTYLKLRYYPLNFLVVDKQNYTIKDKFTDKDITIGFRPETSQLFALSFGRVIGKKRK
jgi:hypothetical protein